MTKNQAKVSLKNLYGEVLSLAPSSLVSFFEIDITTALVNNNVIASATPANEAIRVFRFHNNVSFVTANVVWAGNTYIAMPITADGFELSARGILPTPKLTMTVSDEGISALATLKQQLSQYNDLVGCKVTRIRTLVKFLDPINFTDNVNPDADPNAEFPRDIFFIDRKSQESKDVLQFELASLIDVEGVKIPFRVMVGNRCVWAYRGEGCLYESEPNPSDQSTSNRVVKIHGEYPYSKLPTNAPPVADENDVLLVTLLGVSLNSRGAWNSTNTYAKGDYVFVERDGIKYYFAAKTSVPSGNPPPSTTYWISESCSKLITGCRLRYGTDAAGHPAPGQANGNPFFGGLPFGGFPALTRI